MNPIYHIQVGWVVGNIGDFDRRERRMLMLASAATDLDGIFFWSSDLFHRFHHTFSHNVFFGIFVGGLMAAFARKGRRLKMFILSYAMALLAIAVDFITAPQWPIPLLWPISKTQYYFTEMLGISPKVIPSWDFALEKVMQLSLMTLLLACTVVIYIKFRRTFIELISSNLDRFLTDFAILPFRHRCNFPDCANRAHYECADTGALRCIHHCTIHRDLTITCGGKKPEAETEGDTS